MPISLTSKGMGIKEGDVVTYRWALHYLDKTVFVYDPSKDAAFNVGRRYFEDQCLTPIAADALKVDPAGHVEWTILDAGKPTERASQKTIWYPPYDETTLVDNQFEFKAKKAKKAAEKKE